MASPIFMLDIDPVGVVATHPRHLELPALVAPVPEGDAPKSHNTLRARLLAIGCMRLFKEGFAFDSSLVSPLAERSFTRLAKLLLAIRKQDDADPKRFPPCSVFGHTDPTGEVGYNKTLSGRRARAVYAVLTRDTDIWDDLYQHAHGGDDWRHRGLQVMLRRLGFFSGDDNGKLDEPTKDAVEAFQRSPLGVDDKGAPLKPDRDPGKATRPAIYRAYMDAICHDPDGKRFVLDPKADFLGKGSDANLRGDVQGCGELNPVFVFSKDDEANFRKDPVLAKSVRDPLNAANRRVVVYVFDHGTEVDPTTWPCPHSRDDDTKCKVRLWSDHLKRRNPGPEQREFGTNMPVLTVGEDGALVEQLVEQTGNTMACRFYHGFAVRSPCEVKVKEWVVRFKVDAPEGKQVPLQNRRYVAQLGEAQFAAVIRNTTDANGELRLPTLDEHTRITLKLDVSGKPTKLDESKTPSEPRAAESDTASRGDGFDTDRFPDEDRFRTFIFDAGALEAAEPDNDLAIKQRLYNLGFGEHAPDQWPAAEFDNAMRLYRHRRTLDNASDDVVRKKIISEHDVEDATPEDDDENEAAPANG